MAKRFDALDSKIQTTIGAIVPISLAIPVAFKAFDLKADPVFLVAALVLFIIAIGLSAYSRLHGALVLISPAVLHEGWLGLEPATFKQDMIYFAGDHFSKNAGMLDYRHRILVVTVFMFGLEIACLALSVVLA